MTSQEWARVQLAQHMYDKLCLFADRLSTQEAYFASDIGDLLIKELIPTEEQLGQLRKIFEAHVA